MDPNAALEELRDVTRNVLARRGHEDVEMNSQLISMVEHFDALDGWLSRAGFPPAAWRWGGMGGE
jgi:hypothetical protein